MDDEPQDTTRTSGISTNVTHESNIEIDRSAIVHEWLLEADLLSEEAQNPEALAIAKFLKENTAPAELIIGGWQSSAHTSHETVYVLPLFPNDAQIDENFKQFLQDDRHSASYYPGARLLCLKGQVPTSPIWKGILMLHEGKHAKDHTEERYDWHNPVTFSIKERDTFIFQGDLMHAIGDIYFQDALQEKLEEIKQVTTEHDNGHISFPRAGDYNILLDEAFGTAFSEQEKAARQTALWITAIFKFFDEKYGTTQGAKDKAAFIRGLYGK